MRSSLYHRVSTIKTAINNITLSLVDRNSIKKTKGELQLKTKLKLKLNKSKVRSKLIRSHILKKYILYQIFKVKIVPKVKIF